jgi:hypothetical protein
MPTCSVAGQPRANKPEPQGDKPEWQVNVERRQRERFLAEQAEFERKRSGDPPPAPPSERRERVRITAVDLRRLAKHSYVYLNKDVLWSPPIKPRTKRSAGQQASLEELMAY